MTATGRRSRFDYLILGGGVAGCVLAGRLSEHSGLAVGLVEAGPDYGQASADWPAEVLDAQALPRDDVWDWDGVPGLLRGRLLGGSSCINGCWHTWAANEDFEEWSAAGGPHWKAAALEPYRRRAADAMWLREVGDDELTPWARASLAGAASLGYATISDLAGDCASRGVGRPPINAIGHQRVNAAFAYLDAARPRPNLTILPMTVVDRLTVAGGRVVGAEVVKDGQREVLHAERYVLSAGTYGSPAVLLRSGVGPVAELARIGITARLDLPGVGGNLTDHPRGMLPMVPTSQLNAVLGEHEDADGLYASQILVKAGSFACSADTWDLHILPVGGSPLFGTLPQGVYEVGIAVFLMKPLSRGKVSIATEAPTAPLRIDPGFFTDPEGKDLAVLRDGLRIAWELANAGEIPALAKIADSMPSRRGPDREINAWLRQSASSYWHPVGTCAMGPANDPASVVGEHGKVHGLENLWVVDASIMPAIPRCNTQLPTLAIAELLASAFDA